MNELLIFKINPSLDLDVYYKDRDMKDFVVVSRVKYETDKHLLHGGAEINSNILEYLISNEFPRLKDVRHELCGFISYLYKNEDDCRRVTLNDFMTKYRDRTLSIGDSHILEFNKERFIAKTYFKFKFNKNKTEVVLCYENGNKINIPLIKCSLSDYVNKEYTAIYSAKLQNDIDNNKLNIDAVLVRDILKRTIEDKDMKYMSTLPVLEYNDVTVSKIVNIPIYNILKK
jgi:hypothetical protein